MKPERFTTEMLEVYRYRGTQAWHMLPQKEKDVAHRWYPSYNVLIAHLADTYGKTVQQVAECAAWLSLGCDWHRQAVPQLIRMLAAGENGLSVECSTYKPNKLKAFAVLTTGATQVTKTSPKVCAFTDNLLNPATSIRVTCDRHHIEALTGIKANGKKSLLGNTDASITPHQYSLLERCTQDAADYVGVLPHVLQAGMWDWQKTHKYKW